MFDCSSLCCNSPESCDRVCRFNLSYVQRVREIGTFDLGTVARTTRVAAPSLPSIIPTIYHGGSREKPLRRPWVALPLYSLIDRRHGQARYRTRNKMYEHFGVHSTSRIVATGTAKDAPLERLWSVGRAGRQEIGRELRMLGVELVTTPNFSLFTDRPRWDDMHSMKRIAIVHEEFQSQGLLTALHLNGRTDRDFERWVDFVGERDEITHVAYEFTTGTGWQGRREQHVEWLARFAERVARPLTLIIRGGLKVIPDLNRVFARVVYLDTNAFMKTVWRQRAATSSSGELIWSPSPSRRKSALDELLTHNVSAVERDFLQAVLGIDRSA